MTKDRDTAGGGRRGTRTGRKLTVRGIKAATHTGGSYGEKGKGARQEILWDTVVPGLGLRLYPSGRRSWCLRYRVDGRLRIVTFGRFGVLTLEEARKEARGLLVDLQRTGEDPLAKPRETPTVSDLIPIYLEERREELRRAELKPRTFDAYATKLKIVDRTLGSLAVNAVELEDVERAFARWTTENGPYAANQALRMLRCLLEFAMRKKHREASEPNPTAMIKKNRERSGGRGLSPSELERIGQELNREEARRPEAADTVTAIRLLILTGCRRREITSLTWAEVDFEERCLRLSDSKTGAKVVPLNSAALVVLSELPRQEGNCRGKRMRTESSPRLVTTSASRSSTHGGASGNAPAARTQGSTTSGTRSSPEDSRPTSPRRSSDA